MAVTATAARTSHTETVGTTQEYGTLTLSGTYTTGGFVVNPFKISGTLGSSPMAGTKVLFMQFAPASGYTYVQYTTGQAMTVKILSAPNTELANGTAVPDTSVPFVLTKSKG